MRVKSEFTKEGNREQGTGNREQGTGNREQGANKKQKLHQFKAQSKKGCF
ncbi:MAG: hypothetical protein HEQ13_26835 [Dolichospermum sp. DEX189]|nr:hypothetical protein [Dolichospermum sp. DEX189]